MVQLIANLAEDAVFEKRKATRMKQRVFWYCSNSVFPVWVSKRGLLKWPTVDKIKCMYLRQAMLALVQPLCIPADCWHDVDLIAVKLSDQVRINDVLITCVSLLSVALRYSFKRFTLYHRLLKVFTQRLRIFFTRSFW